jgi:hypothetical protein
MLSVPVDADLLDAANWTFSNFVPSDRAWNGGDMGAWLEGNAVVTPGGEIVNILRVQTKSSDEKAAIVRISADGKTASFDPANGFVNFPGGAKKFVIRYDAATKLYWSLATIVPERHRRDDPAGVRNTLALTCSIDLHNWTVRCILLYHPDVARHGFQYVDWLFDGNDIIAACRTAYDDAQGGAHNNHDANYLTFHRITNFRDKNMADSAAMSEHVETRLETREWLITGSGWRLAQLADGEKAFANRNYLWRDVPQALRNWRYTQTSGGERAAIKVLAKQNGTLQFATAQTLGDLADWKAVPGWAFFYTDTGKTKMNVYRRAVKSGEEVTLPQENWTGGLLFFADF